MSRLKTDNIGSIEIAANYIVNFLIETDHSIIDVLKQIYKPLTQHKLEKIALASTCYHLDLKGYVPSTSTKDGFRATGNVSLRTAENNILIKPSGERFWFLNTDDFILLDLDGNILEGDRNPSIETELHLKTYLKRPDVNAVIHTHPVFSVRYSLDKNNLEARDHCLQEYVSSVPVIEEFPAGSYKLAEETSKALEKTDAVILKNHGLVTIGKTLTDALNITEMVESEAKLQCLSLYS